MRIEFSVRSRDEVFQQWAGLAQAKGDRPFVLRTDVEAGYRLIVIKSDAAEAEEPPRDRNGFRQGNKRIVLQLERKVGETLVGETVWKSADDFTDFLQSTATLLVFRLLSEALSNVPQV